MENQVPEDGIIKQIAKLIDQIETSGSTLTSIKSIVTGILGIINSPDSSPNDLKELIEIDPPLAAKVLRVANSPYYASHRTISDIDQAIIWIGFDALQEIVLTQKFSEIFKNGTESYGFSLEALWRHSLAVALLSKIIYRREYGEKGNNAYAAGLLHDIGIIVEEQFRHDQFKKILKAYHESGNNITKAEKDILGFDHAQLGKTLADHWNFPLELVTAIGCHHNPDKAEQEHVRLASTLYVADFLVLKNNLGFCDAGVNDSKKFAEIAKSLKLTTFSIKALLAVLLEDLEKMEDKGGFIK
ncbi:MAG: HDOD domain-containing protein [Proteobacteria bacterium]|nr:HDOD domain-containing protein [Pseudomonadota bacterium]MBU1708462.1 HDOD domain-containing protein [Pseudomonadota bacterium]